MRKEQIIAIILGSFLGVAVAFGIWRFARQKTEPTPATSSNEQALEQREVFSELAIVSPPDNSVLSISPVQISGFAPPNSLVAVYTRSVYLAKTNEAGEFSVEAELADGINHVVVWSIEKDKAPQVENFSLVYSTKLKSDPDEAAISIKGTVTDITQDTLQLRTEGGEIEQLLVKQETTYVQIGSKTEELEFKDLAIGDFVAALGYKNADEVIEIGRVIVTVEPKAPDIAAIAGTIQTLSRSEFIVLTSQSEEISVDATSSVNTYSAKENITPSRLSTAEQGDPIAIIGSFKDGELVATTIILL